MQLISRELSLDTAIIAFVVMTSFSIDGALAAEDPYHGFPEAKTSHNKVIQNIWNSILTVLRSQDGEISLQTVENAFHTTLPLDEKNSGQYGAFYTGLDPISHRLGITFSRGRPSGSSFTVGWVHDPSAPVTWGPRADPPAGLCVGWELVEYDLQAAGWRENSATPRNGLPVSGELPPLMGFEKGKTNMRVSLTRDGTCFSGLVAVMG